MHAPGWWLLGFENEISGTFRLSSGSVPTIRQKLVFQCARALWVNIHQSETTICYFAWCKRLRVGSFPHPSVSDRRWKYHVDVYMKRYCMCRSEWIATTIGFSKQNGTRLWCKRGKYSYTVIQSSHQYELKSWEFLSALHFDPVPAVTWSNGNIMYYAAFVAASHLLRQSCCKALSTDRLRILQHHLKILKSTLVRYTRPPLVIPALFISWLIS